MFKPLFTLLACALISGCSSYAFPVRDADQNECASGDFTDQRHASSKHSSPVLFDIHLTSAGELVDRCQWTRTMLELGINSTGDDPSKIVLLQIHGWKENASPDNAERAAFKDILESMALDQKNSGTGMQVVGVFVAWPAATWAIPALNNFTFMSRLNVADDISQSSIVAKLVGAIDSIQRKRKRRGKDDIFVMIGYSLGARILFNATAQILLYEAGQAYPPSGSNTYSTIDGPGDLIVLLNPAISANNYTALDSIRRNTEIFPPEQQPVLITIASDSDLVNRYAYSASRWATFNWRHEERATIGEYPPFMTHRLKTESTPRPTAPDEPSWFDRFCHATVCLTRQSASDEDLRKHDKKLPTRPHQPSNPFIVAKAHPDVVDGHSGVLTSEVFDRWLTGFIGTLIRRRALPGRVTTTNQSAGR